MQEDIDLSNGFVVMHKKYCLQLLIFTLDISMKLRYNIEKANHLLITHN